MESQSGNIKKINKITTINFPRLIRHRFADNLF